MIDFIDGGNTAVDGNYQLNSASFENINALNGNSVTFGKPVRNIGFNLRAEFFQKEIHQCCRAGTEQFQAEPEDRGAGHSVDIIVAVDADFLIVS